MNKGKKIFMTVVLVSTTMGFASAAIAANFVASGKVTQIASFNAASAYYDNIELAGVTSAGSCAVDSSTNLVIFRITKDTDGTDPSGNRIFTLALTAFTLGKTLQVSGNDLTLLNGDCEISWAALN